jgi:hypothetical protein
VTRAKAAPRRGRDPASRARLGAGARGSGPTGSLKQQRHRADTVSKTGSTPRRLSSAAASTLAALAWLPIWLASAPGVPSAAELSILFVGDTDFGESYRDPLRDAPLRDLLAERGYDDCLSNFAPLLARSDFVIANLETPITLPGRSPFEEKKKYLHWSDPVEAPDALERHNFGAVSLANNHALDFGPDALRLTMDLLASHGIASFGAGSNEEEARRPWSRTFPVGERELAVTVFGAFEHRERYETDYRFYATEDRAGVNRLEPDRLAAQIAALQRAEPERFLVVFPHWGENYESESPQQREIARTLIDAGADLVLGHGAHVHQGIELHAGRWIFYGLGNFVFNTPGRYADEGVAAISLIVRLIAGETGERLRAYPIFTDNRVTDYRSRFATDRELDETWARLAGGEPELETAGKRGRDEFGGYLELPAGAAEQAEVGDRARDE